MANDNPYSESQFRTLKYRPEFPERFVRSAPKPPALPSEVWINKPVSAAEPLSMGAQMKLRERDKSGDAVGRPSWRSSFLDNPDARFSCEKLNTRKTH